MSKQSKINWLYALLITLFAIALCAVPDSNPDNQIPTTIKTK